MTFSSVAPTLSSPEQNPDDFEKCYINALTTFSKICTSKMMLSFYSRVLNHWESPNACQIACKLFQTNREARLYLSILCRWGMTYLSQLMGAPTPENPRLSQLVHYLTLWSHAGSKSSTGPRSDFTRSLRQTKSKLGSNWNSTENCH